MKTSREDYRKQLEAQFDLWESRLAVLEARAGMASAHARAQLHRQIEELRKLQASARQHVEQIAAGSAAPWNDLKGGLEEAWSKLSAAMEGVWGRIKAEAPASERPHALQERGAREAQEELPRAPVPLRAPQSVRDEHQQLHAALESAKKAPGAVGETARELAGLLHPHFVREEQIAAPPLGLLAPLASGKFDASMLAAIEQADAMRRELPQMLREHESISALARRLEEVARQVGNTEVERFAQDLMAHARSEEELLYPAAILVGDVLRARSMK
jgi:flagellar hook-basal body complex protein FliE